MKGNKRVLKRLTPPIVLACIVFGGVSVGAVSLSVSSIPGILGSKSAQAASSNYKDASTNAKIALINESVDQAIKNVKENKKKMADVLNPILGAGNSIGENADLSDVAAKLSTALDKKYTEGKTAGKVEASSASMETRSVGGIAIYGHGRTYVSCGGTSVRVGDGIDDCGGSGGWDSETVTTFENLPRPVKVVSVDKCNYRIQNNASGGGTETAYSINGAKSDTTYVKIYFTNVNNGDGTFTCTVYADIYDDHKTSYRSWGDIGRCEVTYNPYAGYYIESDYATVTAFY